MGCSQSGYMDSELALAWLKWVEERTAEKASGEKRVIHLDGHITHTSLDFDDYADKHNRILVGYPPDSTDRLQGLDVLHFARIKDLWPKKVREWDADHYEPLRNSGMLGIVDVMWREVFTETNNKKVFEMTGLTRSVNRNAISSRAIAPAEETSISSAYPMPQNKDVREAAAVLAALRKFCPYNPQSADPVTPPQTPRHSEPGAVATPTFLSPTSRQIHPDLFTPRKRGQAYAYHLSHAVTVHLPTGTTIVADKPPEPPIIEHPPVILPSIEDPRIDVDNIPAEFLRTKLKGQEDELRQAHATIARLESTVHSQNAQMLLQHDYATNLQTQLHDKKKKKTSTHTQKYFKDGGRRVYTDPEYRTARLRDQEEADDKRLQKIQGEAIRAVSGRRTQWREDQKAHRRALRMYRDKEVEAWERVCERCTARGERRPRKPARIEGRAETPIRFSTWIEELNNLDVGGLRELQSAVKDIEDKEERKRILFTTIEVMFENPPQIAEADP